MLLFWVVWLSALECELALCPVFPCCTCCLSLSNRLSYLIPCHGIQCVCMPIAPLTRDLLLTGCHLTPSQEEKRGTMRGTVLVQSPLQFVVDRYILLVIIANLLPYLLHWLNFLVGVYVQKNTVHKEFGGTGVHGGGELGLYPPWRRWDLPRKKKTGRQSRTPCVIYSSAEQCVLETKSE